MQQNQTTKQKVWSNIYSIVSKSNENLKTAIKRLSTNFKFEKRAFNKVVEDIKKSER